MKKTKLIKSAVALSTATALLTVGAIAAANLEKIAAYKNYDIDVKYDGVSQIMADANGTRVYPITYEGTTYVPIRAVSNMLGVNVEWDAENYAVLLGKTGTEKSFVEELYPYSIEDNSFSIVRAANNKPKQIASKVYNSYIELNTGLWDYSTSAFYDIGGLYDTLTFKAYSEVDCSITFLGDNDVLLGQWTIKANELPETYTVDVTGVTRLFFKLSRTDVSYPLYLFDMFIK